MKKHLLIIGLALAGCTSSQQDTALSIVPQRQLSPQELRAQLAQQEAASWDQYIGNGFTTRRNLIDETVIEGPIQNNSTAVVFKNFVLRVSWEAKTGAELYATRKTIYEALMPGQSVDIKVKFPTPDEATNVTWSIVKVDADPLTGPNSEIQ